MTRISLFARTFATLVLLTGLAVPCAAETAIDFSTGFNYLFHEFGGQSPSGATLGIAAQFGPELRYEGESRDDLTEIYQYGTVEAHYLDDSSGGTDMRNLYLDLGGRMSADAARFGRDSFYAGGALALLWSDLTVSTGTGSSDNSAWLFGFKAAAGWQHEFSQRHRLFAELYYRGYLHHITGSVAGLSASDYNNAGLVLGYRLRLGGSD